MKMPWTLSDEAEMEAYKYFDKNIRPLPKDSNGNIDSGQKGFQDNDVDAFRHAYVSGVFTQEYSENAADFFGRANEFLPGGIYSNSIDPRNHNMDLWNNSVGRKYGLKFTDRASLAKAIYEALLNGELITELSDKRQYEGASHVGANKSKPVIVLNEDENGRNQIFYDTVKKEVLSAQEFVALIESGKYPGYAVKEIKGVPTPVSNPDGRGTNNLG
jgi:hypothetical protein